MLAAVFFPTFYNDGESIVLICIGPIYVVKRLVFHIEYRLGQYRLLSYTKRWRNIPSLSFSRSKLKVYRFAVFWRSLRNNCEQYQTDEWRSPDHDSIYRELTSWQWYPLCCKLLERIILFIVLTRRLSGSSGLQPAKIALFIVSIFTFRIRHEAGLWKSSWDLEQ